MTALADLGDDFRELMQPLRAAIGDQKIIAGPVERPGQCVGRMARDHHVGLELHRLDRMSRAKTSSARMQVWAVSAAPIAFVFTVEKMSPGFFQPLLDTRPGNVALLAASILWLSAMILARRILKVVV